MNSLLQFILPLILSMLIYYYTKFKYYISKHILYYNKLHDITIPITTTNPPATMCPIKLFLL